MSVAVTLPPAIVLGGNANAVSVARSLGSRGVRVTALGNGHDQVRHSRFCAEFVDVVPGQSIHDSWLDWLSRDRSGAVVLPCDDDALELIGRHRADLTSLGYRPFEADDTVLLDMLDKEATYARARAAGLPTPRTRPIRTTEDVVLAAAEIGFPCALKPVHSHHFAKRFKGRKAFIVNDVDELTRRHAETAEHGLEMIATEIIPGPDDRLCSYYGYLDENGRSLVHATKRKIRQFPRGFGLGSLEITDHAPDVAALAHGFFQSMGLRGLANVEFKRDPRDERLKLIEVNHRFTASNELIRRAGVDLAQLAYARLAGIALPSVDEYRLGLTLWNPLRDLRSVALAAREDVWSLPRSVRTLVRPHVLPVFRLDDPMPSIAHHVGLATRPPAKLGIHRRAGRVAAET